MTGPMMLLAFFAIVSGWVGIPEAFGLPVRDYFSEFVHPSEFARRRSTTQRTPSASC